MTLHIRCYSVRPTSWKQRKAIAAALRVIYRAQGADAGWLH